MIIGFIKEANAVANGGARPNAQPPQNAARQNAAKPGANAAPAAPNTKGPAPNGFKVAPGASGGATGNVATRPGAMRGRRLL